MSGAQNPCVTQADTETANRAAEIWIAQDGAIPAHAAIAAAMAREAAEAASKAREAALVEAINNALCCTPTLRWRGHDNAEIVYDCGNPWEILRAALTKGPDA